jgi:DNA modification methylase
MPEPVSDRPVKSHETIFLLTKQPTYYFDAEAIKEPAVSINDPRFGQGRKTYSGKYGEAAFVTINEKRNCRSVWRIPTSSFSGEHFAAFPKALVKPMVLAGCPVGGTVLDPFGGVATTAIVANALDRKAVLIDANAQYCAMAQERVDKELPRYTAEANSTDAWGNPNSHGGNGDSNIIPFDEERIRAMTAKLRASNEHLAAVVRNLQQWK